MCLRDHLEDFGTEVGYQWLGHIYNLQAYIHFQLGSQNETLGSTTNDALCCFSKAAKAFRQTRNTVSDEGPCLLVNYSNMAWLHFHLGEQQKSQEYIAKVEALLLEYPSKDEIHAEVYAEKAWTLMHFSQERNLEAIEYFQKAISMEPDRVEWHTSQALAIATTARYSSQTQGAELLKKLKTAKENDSNNLYLAAIYLDNLAYSGKVIEDEARELAQRVLQKPVSSYSGIRPLLILYRNQRLFDEAIDVAEEALERHPDGPNNNRYLKKILATCYKWKIFSDRDPVLKKSLTDRAISLFEDVISLYPHSSPPFFSSLTVALASIYEESSQHKAKADLIYKELLESTLEPEVLQVFYNRYAKHFHFHERNHYMEIEYHMKAAEIPIPSKYRNNSIYILEKSMGQSSRRQEIQDFLATLQEEPGTEARRGN